MDFAHLWLHLGPLSDSGRQVWDGSCKDNSYGTYPCYSMQPEDLIDDPQLLCVLSSSQLHLSAEWCRYALPTTGEFALVACLTGLDSTPAAANAAGNVAKTLGQSAEVVEEDTGGSLCVAYRLGKTMKEWQAMPVDSLGGDFQVAVAATLE